MLSFSTDEKSSVVYTATLKDENEAVISSSDVSSLTLSLYSLDDPDRAVINSRNAQSILNANGGTLTSLGALTIVLSSLDNVIVDQTRDFERHLAEVRWTYNAGTRHGSTTFLVIVKNLTKVT